MAANTPSRVRNPPLFWCIAGIAVKKKPPFRFQDVFAKSNDGCGIVACECCLESLCEAIVELGINAHEGAVRLMIACIRLMGQSKFMRSIIDATQ